MATQGPGQQDPRQPGNASGVPSGSPPRPRPVPLTPPMAVPPAAPPGGAAPVARPTPIPAAPGPALPPSAAPPHGAPPGTPAPNAPVPRPVVPAAPVAVPQAAAPPSSIPVAPAAPRRPVAVPPGGKPARPVLVGERNAAAIRTDTPYDEPGTLEEQVKKIAQRFSQPMLVSILVHLLLILMLALWIFHNPAQNTLEIEAEYSDEPGEQLINDQVKDLALDAQMQEVKVTSPLVQTVDDPFSSMQDLSLDLALDGSASSAFSSPVLGPTLSGRDPGQRAGLLSRYGGSESSENAVSMGLAWLARQQQKNGAWSLVGPYKDGAFRENAEAATAMALLCFLADNHTHHDGKYRTNVASGISYLLKQQSADGLFFRAAGHDEILYTQAQCTFALAELYLMTRDPQLKKACQLAVNYCLAAQDTQLGGWRYNRKEDVLKASDTSVTGWMVLALASAKKAGFDVPDTTFVLVDKYLTMATPDRGSQYAYQAYNFDMKALLEGAEITGLTLDQQTGFFQFASAPMTAEGLLCRIYLSQFTGNNEWSVKDERIRRGVQLLLDKHLPRADDRDVYYWYYGTQTMFQMGGDSWLRWNNVLRDMLVESQTVRGPERGSWEIGDYIYGPESKRMTADLWAKRGAGGRLYVTCLSIYMLEVYYRHQRIHGK